jgi:pilus assembly protein CpaE
MPIYLLSSSQPEFGSLESRLRERIPELQKVGSITEVRRDSKETNYLLLPFSKEQMPLERLIDLAARGAGFFFFVFISHDMSGNDYKRLVSVGNAEWVSTEGAPQEIPDIIARRKQAGAAAEPATTARIVPFLPSSGGVGNATLTVEIGVQVKKQRGGRDRNIALIDLDLHSSHVCDLLDIEPRLKIEEISEHPERLDTHLFELFISRHSSGLDVFATSRTKLRDRAPSMEALDTLFTMMAQRYELILVDLPVAWGPWTAHILGASALTVITGLNTIPSLRQVAESVAALQQLERPPPKIVVALNRCETGLLRRVQGTKFVRKMLHEQTVFWMRNDAKGMLQSVNAGVPISISSPSSGLAKDIAKLTAEVCPVQRPAAKPKATRTKNVQVHRQQ